MGENLRERLQEGRITEEDLLVWGAVVLGFVSSSGKSIFIESEGKVTFRLGPATDGEAPVVNATPAEADLYTALEAGRLGVTDEVISAGSALKGMAVAMGYEPGLHSGE